MMKYILTISISLIVGIGTGTWLLGSPTYDVHEHEQAETYRCPMHPTVVSDRPGSCPVCGMDMAKDIAESSSSEATGEREVAYWRAPMDPSYTADAPGKSPMGMDLVPVYVEEAVSTTIKIDPVTVQNIGVKTETVRRQRLNRSVRAVGRVDYDETRMTDVNTKIAGWVEKLHVDYTGQLVEKGQPLLEIYSPELVAAQEEHLTALDYKRRVDASPDTDAKMGGVDLLQASRHRLHHWDVTMEQIQQLESTGVVTRTMTVYSPQEGAVVHKAVYEGEHIHPGQHLYRIAELSPVWVYAHVYEYELPWVREGQEAQVELSYLPGKQFTGTVTHIFPFLEPETRTVKVRLSLPNPDFELKPEMYASVTIHSPVSKDALVVPAQAIIHSGERRVAVVSLGDGRFQPRDITIGVEADGLYEVLDGLSDGERIVTSAQFLIDSESNLKAAVRAMVAQEAEGMVPDPHASQTDN